MTEEIKVLITGASGLLGRTVYKYFNNKSFQSKYPLNENVKGDFLWKCLGLCNTRIKGDLRKIDISDYGQVESLLKEFQVKTK